MQHHQCLGDRQRFLRLGGDLREHFERRLRESIHRARRSAAHMVTAEFGDAAVHRGQQLLRLCLIHLDDEEMDAGPLKCVPGSHRWGVVSHLNPDGKFAYQATGRKDLNELPGVYLCGKAGMVTFHHCLTMHHSAPKKRAGHRRFVIFQYRAHDAKQLAGVIWKCHGMQVEDRPPGPSVARFADGSTVELRGMGGRLFDVAGQLAPSVTHAKGHPAQGKSAMAAS